MKQTLYTGLVLNTSYKPLVDRTFTEDKVVLYKEIVQEPKEINLDSIPNWVFVGVFFLLLLTLFINLVKGPVKKIFIVLVKIVFGIYILKFLRR